MTEETLVQCGACDTEHTALVRIGAPSARVVCDACGTVGTYPLEWTDVDTSADWTEVRTVVMWTRVETMSGWPAWGPDDARVTDGRDITAMFAGV